MASRRTVNNLNLRPASSDSSMRAFKMDVLLCAGLVLTGAACLGLHHDITTKDGTRTTPGGEQLANKKLRIIDGKKASISQFPYQAALFVSGRFKCGASIVSDSWVLTAAHCLISNLAREYTIQAGCSNIVCSNTEEHQKRQATRLEKRQDHKGARGDLAVVKVEPPFQFNKHVQPIKLPTAGLELMPGTLVTVTGWGSTEEDGRPSDHLNEVSLQVVNPSTCAQRVHVPLFLETVLCVGQVSGREDTCKGDSGGPLVWGQLLVGVVSGGEGCGRPLTPGVYTKLSHYRSWLHNTTGI